MTRWDLIERRDVRIAGLLTDQLSCHWPLDVGRDSRVSVLVHFDVSRRWHVCGITSDIQRIRVLVDPDVVDQHVNRPERFESLVANTPRRRINQCVYNRVLDYRNSLDGSEILGKTQVHNQIHGLVRYRSLRNIRDRIGSHRRSLQPPSGLAIVYPPDITVTSEWRP